MRAVVAVRDITGDHRWRIVRTREKDPGSGGLRGLRAYSVGTGHKVVEGFRGRRGFYGGRVGMHKASFLL